MTHATRMTCVSLEMHGIPIMRELKVTFRNYQESACMVVPTTERDHRFEIGKEYIVEITEIEEDAE